MTGLSIAFDRTLDRQQWSDFNQCYNTSPLLAGPEWQGVLGAAHKVNVGCLTARDASGLRGLLPLYHVRSLRRRVTVYSLPRGLVAVDPAAAIALLQAATDHARSLNAQRAVVSSASQYNVACRQSERQVLILPLKGDEDACWNAMRDKTRNSIRKAVKSGLVLTRGWSRLGIFYAVHAERMAAKGVPFHPRAYFDAIADAFRDRGDVFIAEKDGIPVGAMLLIWSGQQAVYFAGGVSRSGESYGTSQFILWEMAKHALSIGIRSIDLGESAIGSGVYRFKTMFGAVPSPLWYYDLLQPAVSRERSEAQRQPSVIARVEATALALAPDVLRRAMLRSIRRRSSLV